MNRKTFAAKTGAALLTASLLATSIPLGAAAASVQRVTALLRPETSIVVDGSARTFYKCVRSRSPSHSVQRHHLSASALHRRTDG